MVFGLGLIGFGLKLNIFHKVKTRIHSCHWQQSHKLGHLIPHNATTYWFQVTLLGCPISGLFAHLCLMTSLIRCFCPLYVVKMAILSAGYPRRRMYMKIATAYSASPRFYKNKQDKKWRNCFSNTGFTDFRVRFITISQIGILLSHSKTDMTYAEGGSFGSYLTPGSLGTWSEGFLYLGS